MTNSRSEYVGIRAVLWVFDEAPDVPPQLVSTLLGLARHADDAGRNAYPSQAVLARYTRKSTRQVKKDLAGLVDKGLIRVAADQSAAASLRADRRPVVYELACTAPRTHGVSHTTGREVPPGTGRQGVEDHTGGTPGAHGVSPSSSEEDRTSREQPSLPRERAIAPEKEEKLTSPSNDVARLAGEVGATPEEITELIRRVNAERPDVKAPLAWLRRLHQSNDLAPRLRDVRSARLNEHIVQEIENARRDRRMECEHGTPGGSYRRPDTGKSATCASCRRKGVSSDAA